MATPIKNVLHIISAGGFGGGERYLLDLIRFSSGRFRHVAVLPYNGPLSDRLDSAGNDFRIIKMSRVPSVKEIVKLCRFCRQTGADIIHSHGFRANIYGRLAGVLCRKPQIATIHVSLYDYLETASIIRKLYQLVEKRTSFITRRFICVSETMAKDTRRLGVRPDRIVVINNGVDTNRFCPGGDGELIKRKFDIYGRHPVIGTVGRLVAEKGQSTLISALADLKGDFPDMVCLFVGEGPLLETLGQEALSADVSDMCRFTGPVVAIEEVYTMLDLFVLPSSREPFGLAALEAMASGVAVLATDAGGPTEYILSGVNGVLVSPGQPSAMAREISTLLSDTSLRLTIAKAGLQSVNERYDVRKAVSKIETVYKSF